MLIKTVGFVLYTRLYLDNNQCRLPGIIDCSILAN